MLNYALGEYDEYMKGETGGETSLRGREFQDVCISEGFATDVPSGAPSQFPTEVPSVYPSSVPTSNPTVQPTTLVDRRQAEADYNCDCDNCEYFYLESMCTNTVYVNQTVYITQDDDDNSGVDGNSIIVDNTERETEQDFGLIGGFAAGALIIGFITGKLFFAGGGSKEEKPKMKFCIATTNTGQPCTMFAAEGSEYCKLHEDREKGQEVDVESGGGGKIVEDDDVGLLNFGKHGQKGRALSIDQKQTAKSITSFMTPTKNTKGATKLRRVVRERLTKLQKEEKEGLMRKIGEANESFEREMRRKEEVRE